MITEHAFDHPVTGETTGGLSGDHWTAFKFGHPGLRI